ncbi:MAG TPA: GNAT family N-acetyltransferase, partial [Thermoplasmata archaeon]|nr:GNAT family N-acetyltransferase [Thermoplasmata archaeon]
AEPELPRPARDAPSDELLLLTHHLRQELTRRGEFITPAWVEEAARDLKSGELPGWWLSEKDGAPGIALYSARNGRVYAHAHLEPGPGGPERLRRLVCTLVASLPSSIRRADIGLSGLSESAEAEVCQELVGELGGQTVVRRCLERPVGASDGAVPFPIPGSRLVPVRSIPLDLLAELDWRGFQGTPDEALVAESLEEDRRGLRELLDNRLGRFLDEASFAYVSPDDQLLGCVLVAEQNPRRAIVLDIVVDPAARRRGVGRFLLRTALRAVRALGFEGMRLWVTETNAPANGLYGELGFEPSTVARIYRWFPGDRAPAHPQTDR